MGLLFPIVAEAISPDEYEAQSAAPVIPGGHEGILVVEDDAAIRNAARRALESKGYRVWVAADGVEGLATFREHEQEVALVLSDLVMPRMTGREMAEAIHGTGSRVPVLFSSGHSTDWIYGDAVVPNEIHVLPKPWTLTALFLRVRAAIDSAGRSS